MRDGACRSCGGQEIYAARNATEPGDPHLRAHIEPGFRGMRPQTRVEVWNYLCATCGLLETYLLDPAAIDFARQAWIRVLPPPPIPPAPATPSGT